MPTPTINEGHRLLEAFIRIERKADRERLIFMAEAMLCEQLLPGRSTLKH